MNRALLLVSTLLLTQPGFAADPLVGTWRADFPPAIRAGKTNQVEAFRIIEFKKNRSVKITDTFMLDGDRRSHVPYSGTYTLTGSNEVTLSLISLDAVDPSKPRPIPLSCYLIANELRVPVVTPGTNTEYQVFHRTKR